MQPTSTTAIPAAKISLAFEQARHEGRGVLIPYFMCGYPSATRSIELILAAAQAGADIIELGMPFSDPLADGATIQHAGHVALERGMSINGCIEIARQVSSQSTVPLLFMGYYNPILAYLQSPQAGQENKWQEVWGTSSAAAPLEHKDTSDICKGQVGMHYGIERFCQAAADCGVSGLIIPDLPPEEAGPLQQAAQHHGLAIVFLIPPTTSDERITQIASSAAKTPGSFIYCVSLSGVTGARTALPTSLRSFIERVREHSKQYSLPIAVGFGLSTPQHIAEVTSYADGAVVGSALVNLIDQHNESEQVEAVKHYIQSLRQARTS